MISPKIETAYRKIMSIHPPTVFRALHYLSEVGEASVTQIHEALDMNRDFCSELLSRVHRQGYVNKRIEGRTVYVSLNEENLIKTTKIIHQLIEK